MQPASETSPGRSRARALVRGALPLMIAAAAGCAPRDAQVGLAPLVDGGGTGGTGAASGDAASAVLFSSEFGSNGGLWQVFTPLPGATVAFGVHHASAGDGRVAELRYPGDPNLTAADRTDADLNTGIATRNFFRYGTFRARVQFATCSPGEDIASAVYLYFADGSDGNGNGIADVHELDLHVLCGTPAFIVLTGWSDYELKNGVESYLKRSHAIDTATGDVYDTLTPSDPNFTKTGNAPELAHAGFPAADTFYEVGIDWQPAHVRFFIVLGGAEVTLWNLTEVQYVPQVPLPMGFNLWHPATHWVPTRMPADYPASDGVLLVDWAEWRAP
jgi:hypothetical protein